MTPAEVAAILRQFNEWLRGDRYDIAAPTTREMGEAIDAAIEMIERTQELEIATWDFTWSNDSESQADCARAVLEKSK